MRLLKYIFRWQLSTPILWIIVYSLGTSVISTILANLIGALIFYKIDQYIFCKNDKYI